MSDHPPFKVAHNRGSNRFEIAMGDRHAFMNIGFEKEILVLLHTEVPRAFQGKGAGAALVRHAMAYAAERKWKVVALCPYAKAWLAKHEEYAVMILPLEALRKDK